MGVKPLSEAFVSDGDRGSGEPGSLQRHVCHIAQIDTVQGRCAYLAESWPNMSEDVKLELVIYLMTELYDGDGNWGCNGCAATIRG